jgi:hypothetical protein
VYEQVRRRLWGSLAVQWPLAPRGHAPLRSQCHLVFGEKDIFTMRTARAARKTVTISTILLAGLAELFVKKLINRKN